MFSGVYWNQLVCPPVRVSIRVSVCVQTTSFCQSADGGIKTYLATALVLFVFHSPFCSSERTSEEQVVCCYRESEELGSTVMYR